LFKIKQSFGNPYLLASWTHDSDCCTSWYQVECDRTTNRIISLTIFAGELSGQLPPSIGDLPFLEHLTFRKLTNVTGPIQPAIAKLNRLNFLRLDHLNLTGSVPGWLGQLKSLTFTDLSFNSLTGSIPSELARLPNLEALHLDRNKLTGRIPDSFGKFPKSPSLYLSHNQLSGPIPTSMANYNTDSGIDLSRNRLEGDASILFGCDKSTWSVDLSRNLRPQCNRKRMEGSTSPNPAFATFVVVIDLLILPLPPREPKIAAQLHLPPAPVICSTQKQKQNKVQTKRTTSRS
ncbi:Polygalacturonase inhibitor, partial [Linum perenne]